MVCLLSYLSATECSEVIRTPEEKQADTGASPSRNPKYFIAEEITGLSKMSTNSLGFPLFRRLSCSSITFPRVESVSSASSTIFNSISRSPNRLPPVPKFQRHSPEHLKP